FWLPRCCPAPPKRSRLPVRTGLRWRWRSWIGWCTEFGDGGDPAGSGAGGADWGGGERGRAGVAVRSANGGDGSRREESRAPVQPGCRGNRRAAAGSGDFGGGEPEATGDRGAAGGKRSAADAGTFGKGRH